MPSKNGELFPTSPRRKTRAPAHLSVPQIRQITKWAERKVPWVSRGAFEAFTTVEDYIEEVLEWWQATGKMRMDWPLTVQNRIRQLERSRVTRMARAGSLEAQLALRDPAEWMRRYDQKQRAVPAITSSGGEGLMRPSGGTVISLPAPGRRR